MQALQDSLVQDDSNALKAPFLEMGDNDIMRLAASFHSLLQRAWMVCQLGQHQLSAFRTQHQLLSQEKAGQSQQGLC